MFRFYKIFSYLSYLSIPLALTLSGCASKPDETSLVLVKQNAKERANQLADLQHWIIKGKIAFIGKKNTDSATLYWLINGREKSQELNLTTYLGINVLQLISIDNNHTLHVDGKTYHGQNLEELVGTITGRILPTKALSYWLKGIPYLENDSISYQEGTQLPQVLSSYYNNERWQVTYGNYKQVEGYNLATTFSIKKDDLLIKIAINDWLITKTNK